MLPVNPSQAKKLKKYLPVNQITKNSSKMPCLILAVLLLLICIVVLPVTGASKRHGIEREVRKKYYLVGGLTVRGVVILFRNQSTFPPIISFLMPDFNCKWY